MPLSASNLLKNMSKKKSMKFKEIVTVSEGFSRSINIASDINNDSIIQNYVCPHSSASVLYSMVSHIEAGQCAFTWTGPYGSGKSSLGLFLTVIADQKAPLYRESIAKIPVHQTEIKAFFSTKKYRIHPITGALSSPVRAIAEAFDLEPSVEAIIAHFEALAKGKTHHLIMIDEMGKFLEYSARQTDDASDVYLYQQIAEIANRSQGRLVFIGILHQSLMEYARGLSKSLRDEWLKVQGRFIDLAVNAAGEEQLELIGKAILSDKKPIKPTAVTEAVVKEIKHNRPIDEAVLTPILSQTWPLHPVVATLLVPVSQKQFSQNQRSIFSFLSSAEPYGFQHFLENADVQNGAVKKGVLQSYTPVHYWAYLTANLENAILSSADANRWILAREALSRATAQNLSALAVTLLKWIILIDLFKGNSGLTASKALFMTEFSDGKAVESALDELLKLHIIRKADHAGRFALFNGSNFNLEEAQKEAEKHITELNYQVLNQIAGFKPIIAKRHYHQTGTMRWLDAEIVPFKAFKHGDIEASFNQSAIGALYLLLPQTIDEAEASHRFVKEHTDPDRSILLAIPKNYEAIYKTATELLITEWVAKHDPELAGDRIARAEVENEQTHLASRLNEALTTALDSLVVYHNGKKLGVLSARDFSQLASTIADEIYHLTPILRSEMLNTDKPSGSANGGLNALLKRMVLNIGEPRLGIEGYPAEGGLYKILLEDTGLYGKNACGDLDFTDPDPEKPYRLQKLWHDTDAFLSSRDGEFTLAELHQFWQTAPYGIKQGLLSFLTLSYLLTRRGYVASYIDNTYLTEIDDLFVDYLTKSAKNIAFRFVPQTDAYKAFLDRLIETMKRAKVKGSYQYTRSPLEISRSLVKMLFDLNEWVHRTKQFDKKTTLLREALKRARDPHHLIFDEMTTIFDLNGEDSAGFSALENSLIALQTAYPEMLKALKEALYSELQISIDATLNKADFNETDFNEIQARAESVHNSSGDFRIDALAARLKNYRGTQQDLEGILGLAANKPTYDWIDKDVERATIELASLCRGFKRAELFSHLKGKKSHRHSVAVISSFAGEDAINEASFEFLESDQAAIDQLKKTLDHTLNKALDKGSNNPNRPELVLAALAQLSEIYINKLKEK